MRSIPDWQSLVFTGWILGSALLSAAEVGQPAEIQPPLGPHIFLTEADFAGSTSYSANDRVVSTSYFYWYDVYSQAHLVNSDGSDALTDHPPTTTGFSYISKAWHKTQMLDMMAAGIDVLLPVYWGAPSERLAGKPPEQQSWSYAGLVPLVRAREELLTEGKAPPKIGMFYDTSTLQYNAWGRHIDLTTDYGRRWFYESVRDFFSLVPPKHWAMIEGKPIIFLYSASFAVRHNQSCIDYLNATFAREFGGRAPYIVREISWNVRSEQVYAWGGALGLKNPGVASLGPGYDHSAVPGRTPLIVDREEGQFFARNWEKFLRRPSNLMTVETWNEYHEGTDIAASKEYGRKYIELNRKYVDMFKQGIVPPRPQGPYTDARSLSVTLGATNQEQGLVQFDHADGVTAPASIGGNTCRSAQKTEHGGRYVYFRIDDSFKTDSKMDVSISVEFYDASAGRLGLEYDGSDTNAPFAGAYTASPTVVNLSGSKTWKTAVFALPNALFSGAQNGGADFRLAINASEFYVRRVELVRPGLRAEAWSSDEGFRLALFGDGALRCQLERSTDLRDWRVVTMLRPDLRGEFYTDAGARRESHGWYRARFTED
ncbi:MAG: DUF5010 domain-containing protein [Verrucomicrobiia bacterium]